MMYYRLDAAISAIRRKLREEEEVYFYETDDGKYEVRDARTNSEDVVSSPDLINRYMRFTDEGGGLIFKYHHNVENSCNTPIPMSANDARRVVILFALAEVEYLEEVENVTSLLVKSKPRI